MRLIRLLAACLILAALSLGCSMYASAAPVAPVVITITQPDGTSFEAVPFGDEWMNGYETIDGYTIVPDPDTGFWYYADLGDEGALVPGELLPGRDDPSALPKHLRPALIPGGEAGGD
ncbi:MAG: hypothetical protein M1370_11740 [Bacteroidetes bacterium]|nr:hypothetical protein [Bacteroidota bacterium]MCL5025970.1 hypothetical protein [Chloroflexota bacterium]